MDSLTKQIRLQDDETLQDVTIREGRIIEIAPVITGDIREVIEVGGHVLIPGFVEGHLHLDETLVADRKLNRSDTLKGAVEVTAELKPASTEEDIYDRAKCVLEMLTVRGATALRTHAKSDPTQGFAGFKTIMHLKEEYKELIDMQVVMLPQEGIFKAPGTERMIYEAVGMGADIVNGIPYNDAPAKEHIDLVLEIVKEYDRDVGLHQNFADEVDDTSAGYSYEKTTTGGYQGRISVGHLTTLHVLPEAELTPIITKVAEANISVIILSVADLHSGVRGDQYNVRCAVMSIHKLRDGGVNICTTTNNIHNAFTPYGTENIVQIAMLAIPVGHLGGADNLKIVLPMVTTSPARTIGLEGYGIAVRSKADLVLLDTKAAEHAIIDIPEWLYVIKNDRVTVKTDKEVEIIRQEKNQKI